MGVFNDRTGRVGSEVRLMVLYKAFHLFPRTGSFSRVSLEHCSWLVGSWDEKLMPRSVCLSVCLCLCHAKEATGIYGKSKKNHSLLILIIHKKYDLSEKQVKFDF